MNKLHNICGGFFLFFLGTFREIHQDKHFSYCILSKAMRLTELFSTILYVVFNKFIEFTVLNTNYAALYLDKPHARVITAI